MMKYILSFVAFLSLALGLWIFLCAILNDHYFKRTKKKAFSFHLEEEPLVSIVIPARNEENHLPRLLSSIEAQTYGNLEVLVIDDQSSDKTGEIIQSYVEKDARFHHYKTDASIRMSSHGKVNALLQAIPHAKGKYMLCTDADTWEAPQCIETAVKLMESQKLDLLSGFPAQYSGSAMANLVTSCMLFATAVLPQLLLAIFPIARFAIGIGQFIMMKRDTYQELGGYMSANISICDDLAIIKHFVRNKKRYCLTNLSSELSCTMYDNGKDAFRGLERSICGVFPGTLSVLLGLLVVVFVLMTIFWAPLLFPFYIWGGAENVYVFLFVGWLLCSIGWYKTGRDLKFTHLTSILAPLSVTLICTMFLHGTWIKKSGKKFTWKGRQI